jgi:hypothetical protein
LLTGPGGWTLSSAAILTPALGTSRWHSYF